MLPLLKCSPKLGNFLDHFSFSVEVVREENLVGRSAINERLIAEIHDLLVYVSFSIGEWQNRAR